MARATLSTSTCGRGRETCLRHAPVRSPVVDGGVLSLAVEAPVSGRVRDHPLTGSCCARNGDHHGPTGPCVALIEKSKKHCLVTASLSKRCAWRRDHGR